MDDITSYITAGAGALSALLTIIIAICKGRSNSKKTKEAYDMVEYLEKLNAIISKIPAYIKQAETIFGAGNGLAKKNYTQNNINIDCIRAGVEYDEEVFEKKIEEILETPQKKVE